MKSKILLVNDVLSFKLGGTNKGTHSYVFVVNPEGDETTPHNTLSFLISAVTLPVEKRILAKQALEIH